MAARAPWQQTVRERLKVGDKKPVENVMHMSETWQIEMERMEERQRAGVQ